MRNFVLAACLAVGLTFAGVGQSEAQAQHGFYGRDCNPGFNSGFYGVNRGGFGGGVAGFSPYNRFYAPPVVVVPRVYTGVYGVSRVGVSPFGVSGVGVNPYGFGYNNIPASRFQGGFGNLGYPRSVLRLGF